ncbi:hypothetical protein QE152_g10462 [Popillia japonica]|uniref:Uncharacterized protein n=1 Tax=Popillia japonica TaxID=7064 RepID=A0AAW1LV37_POPJA
MHNPGTLLNRDMSKQGNDRQRNAANLYNYNPYTTTTSAPGMKIMSKQGNDRQRNAANLYNYNPYTTTTSAPGMKIEIGNMQE